MKPKNFMKKWNNKQVSNQNLKNKEEIMNDLRDMIINLDEDLSPRVKTIKIVNEPDDDFGNGKGIFMGVSYSLDGEKYELKIFFHLDKDNKITGKYTLQVNNDDPYTTSIIKDVYNGIVIREISYRYFYDKGQQKLSNFSLEDLGVIWDWLMKDAGEIDFSLIADEVDVLDLNREIKEKEPEECSFCHEVRVDENDSYYIVTNY